MIATWTTYADAFLHVKQLFELMLVSTGGILHDLKYKLYNVIYTIYRYQILYGMYSIIKEKAFEGGISRALICIIFQL